MRAVRRWQVEGAAPSDVVDCLTEWLEAYQFVVQSKGRLFKKRLLAKTEQSSGRETLRICFEFEAQKAPEGTALKADYYGTRVNSPVGKLVELDISVHEKEPSSFGNPELYFLREYAKALLPALEKYFNLEERKASVWHDKDLDVSVFSEARIHEVLSEDVTELRDVAKKLAIEKIGDLRKLQRTLVGLCRSKPETFGGFYGTRVTGGYTKYTSILEGSFWRRDTTAK